MDVLDTILSFVKLLLLALLASIALLAVLAIVISLLPKDNPVRELLVALTRPIGIMIASTLIAVPVEWIPFIDLIYDVVATGFILYFWLQFFGDARRILPQLASSLAAERGYRGAQKLADEKARAEQAAAQVEEEMARLRQQEEARRQASDGPMTRVRALEVLELGESATREEVQAAYTGLMKKVHPDIGGSTFFAKQLNEARDVLLA